MCHGSGQVDQLDLSAICTQDLLSWDRQHFCPSLLQQSGRFFFFWVDWRLVTNVEGKHCPLADRTRWVNRLVKQNRGEKKLTNVGQTCRLVTLLSANHTYHFLPAFKPQPCTHRSLNFCQHYCFGLTSRLMGPACSWPACLLVFCLASSLPAACLELSAWFPDPGFIDSGWIRSLPRGNRPNDYFLLEFTSCCAIIRPLSWKTFCLLFCLQ